MKKSTIALLFTIISVIMIIIVCFLNQINYKEKIIDCYDQHGNKIIDLKCKTEKGDLQEPYNYCILILVIIFGLSFIMYFSFTLDESLNYKYGRI